jgi:arsenate reductase
LTSAIPHVGSGFSPDLFAARWPPAVTANWDSSILHRMEVRKKVLFVCIGNSCRSQMAEALAKHHARDVIDPASAGVSPFGSIMEGTLNALRLRGISAEGQYSKGLGEAIHFQPDLIVNMSGVTGKSLFPRADVVDWRVQDPYGEDVETYLRICDDIEARVKKLAEGFRAKHRERRSEAN